MNNLEVERAHIGDGVSYYDPYPALYIERPKVLVGPVGGGIALTARPMLGLPLIDVDRLVEHELVRTGHDREHGWKKWRNVEFKMLKRSMAQRPAGIIALGEGQQDERTRDLVMTHGEVGIRAKCL